MYSYKSIIWVALMLLSSCGRSDMSANQDQNSGSGSNPSTGSATTPNFKVYNAIHYVNTPDLNTFNVHTLNLFNEASLTKTDPADAAATIPDSVKISSIARQSGTNPGVPVTLDIEDWLFDSAATRAASLNKYLSVVKFFKNVNAQSKIGFYNTVPKPMYQWSSLGSVGSASYNNWQSINDYIKPLADKVDVFYPAFYTYDTDTIAWKNLAVATISEIKRYNTGKPIITYLHPQYHDNTPLARQFIPANVWRRELEFAYSHTDGVVIWTSNLDADNNKISWDPSMPWWQATQDFIKAHNIQ